MLSIRRRNALDLGAFVAASGCAVAISREVAEREPLGLDRMLPLALHDVGPWLDAIARAVTVLGNGAVVFAASAIGAALLAARGA